MKICVTSTGDNLDSAVDPRFGRCAYFIFVEPETLKFEAFKNDYAEAQGGAGIQSGQLVAGKKAEAVLTGNVGPNAYQTLSSFGLKVFVGAKGTIKQAILDHKDGKLKQADNPTSASHSGMSR